MELDYLVIAAHPDDAEIGVGGTILGFKAQGAKVGVLDLTSGEPTPHGTPEIRARETEAASQILALDWRGNLGLPNRSLVADLEARRHLAGYSAAAEAARASDALLGRCPSRPRRRQRPGGRRALLGQADQDRFAGRSPFPASASCISSASTCACT